MLIDTLRFGQVEIDEDKILNFKEGIPGLEGCKRFTILQFEESKPIMWMQSVDDSEISLPVLDSFYVMPDYNFVLNDEDVQELELKGPEDVLIISVLVIPDDISEMTANLAAPIVINMRNGEARQVILNGAEHSVRHPIFNELATIIKEEDADAGAVTEIE